MLKFIKISIAVLILLITTTSPVTAQAPLEVKPMTAEQYIEKIFGSKAEIAKAVILHESGNNLRAMNWNCWYYRTGSDGIVRRYSTFCKKPDRPKAWSVDCGIAQINVRGRYCPEHLFTLEGNMGAVEKIYKTQGLNAWVSYKTGAYKKFL